MLRRVVFGALICALLSGAGALTPAEASLPTKKTWLADVRHAMHGSQAFLDARVARGGKRLAVNLDIDNTTLATRYAPGHPVPAVLRFAKHARAQGVSLVFNTARRRGHGRITRAMRELRAAGYSVARICGRSPGESVPHGKQRCRRRFVRQGYTIAANVGNRRTDFVGGNYERAFRLPSYHDQLS